MLAILKDWIPPNRNQIVFLLIVIAIHIIAGMMYLKTRDKTMSGGILSFRIIEYLIAFVLIAGIAEILIFYCF